MQLGAERRKVVTAEEREAKGKEGMDSSWHS